MYSCLCNMKVCVCCGFVIGFWNWKFGLCIALAILLTHRIVESWSE